MAPLLLIGFSVFVILIFKSSNSPRGTFYDSAYWNHVFQKQLSNDVEYLKSLSDHSSKDDVDDLSSSKLNLKRQAAVKKAAVHAWKSYSKNCWGKDEINPVEDKCVNWLNQGSTIMDRMDTLLIMGFTEEFTKARNWVIDSMDTESDSFVSFFETGIRILGGMLSAYELTGEVDMPFLERCQVIGDKLLKVLNTPSGMPQALVNFKTGEAKSHYRWHQGDFVVLAEVASNLLQFTTFSYHTRDSRYKNAAQSDLDLITSYKKPIKGLYPLCVKHTIGGFCRNWFYREEHSIGGRGDSFYEYLLKMWILGDK
jgi:mRNA-degrading endonuclease RelE of RelBE toxin-antitoxin system